MTSSSVVLPSPLRPTMPMRSPAATPSETSASSGRTPYDLETRSRLTRLAGAALMRPPRSSHFDDLGAGDRTGRHQDDFLPAAAQPRRHGVGGGRRLGQEDAGGAGPGDEASYGALGLAA